MTVAGSLMPLDDFVEAARSFLDGAARKRTGGLADALAEDRVALFRGSTAEEAASACAWQRTVFDAGYGWLTGPVEEGGAGLPAEYERAHLSLCRP